MSSPGAATSTAPATTIPDTQPAAEVTPFKYQNGSDSSHGIAWALGSALLAGLIFNVMPLRPSRVAAESDRLL